MKTNIAFTCVIFIVMLAAIFSFAPRPNMLEKVSAEMETKQAQSGKFVVIKAEVCYQRNGNMVTHFTFPRNYVITSNRFGEVKVYDPSNNTVIKYQSGIFTSQSSQFYYFFSGKSADMGLTDIGYVPEKTTVENGLVISLWKLKIPDRKSLIQRVKLVHQLQRPVYMHYENGEGKIIRKVYYSNYLPVENSYFPHTSTEIIYNGVKDSTVTKTSFSNIKLNSQAVSPYFDFKVPENAKISQQ